MAAITISPRVVWNDDTGTPEAPAGNGTIINNAQVQLIQDRVDELHSGVRIFTLGGLFRAEGFGIHDFHAGGTGNNLVRVFNTAAGAVNAAGFQIYTNAGVAAQFLAFSTTYAAQGEDYRADTVVIEGMRPGGVTLAAPMGNIRLNATYVDLTKGNLHAVGRLVLYSNMSYVNGWKYDQPGLAGFYLNQEAGSPSITIYTAPVNTGAAGAAANPVRVFELTGDGRLLLPYAPIDLPAYSFAVNNRAGMNYRPTADYENLDVGITGGGGGTFGARISLSRAGATGFGRIELQGTSVTLNAALQWTNWRSQGVYIGPSPLTLDKADWMVIDYVTVQFQRLATSTGGANAIIDPSGGTFYRSTSARRYKRAIAPLTVDPDRVLDLAPVTYCDARDEAEVNRIPGFIAEDVAAVIPDLVDTVDGAPESVRYDRVSAYLLVALQSMHARIAALEGRTSP
jgi:hypothetical protein